MILRIKRLGYGRGEESAKVTLWVHDVSSALDDQHALW